MSELPSNDRAGGPVQPLSGLVEPSRPVNAASSAAAGPPAAQPIVAAERLTLAYGRKPVLTDASLRIGDGDFWCFLGANGEGKTTLIRALLGALRPARGKVWMRSDFRSRTRVGFVPQECDLNRSLPTTVREFILTGMVGQNLDGATREARLNRVLEIMGLQRARMRSFWALSGGQRQRASVARALVRDPLLLVVDEPTAGLDPAAAAGLLEIITDLNRTRGITVVFVTHDLSLAAERASHVALFCKGRLLAGPLAEVFTEEALTRTFGVPIRVDRLPDGRTLVHTGKAVAST